MLNSLNKRNIKILLTPLNIFSKNSSKRFNSNLRIKEIKPLETTQIELKDFYFQFRGLEYRSQIPKSVEQSLEEFLHYLAKHQVSGQKVSTKDFEVARAGHYLPRNIIVNSLPTSADDKNPVIIFDDKLTYENRMHRNLMHLKNPFEAHSQSMQNFLNDFIETVKIDENKIKPQNIKTLLKSFSDIKKNKSKQLIAFGSFLSGLKSSTENKIDLEIKSNTTLELDRFNKPKKENVLLLHNKEADLLIPVNLVTYNSQEEMTKNFDREIIDNFDSLRRVALLNNKKTNFGVVTDFYNWKFNYYHRADLNLVEQPNSYLTSLKYRFDVNSEFVDTKSYSILLKVISGMAQLKSDVDLSSQ